MYCPKCGNEINKGAFFCQWCGEKIDLVEVGAITERIKYIRKLFDERAALDLELCKYVSRLYRDGKYLQKYDSLEAFGQNELGIDKASMFMYKNVGENFLDNDGEPLIPGVMEWGLGKLNELYTLDIKTINLLIKLNYIAPSMSLKDLRICVKGYKQFLKEYQEGTIKL